MLLQLTSRRLDSHKNKGWQPQNQPALHRIIYLPLHPGWVVEQTPTRISALPLILTHDQSTLSPLPLSSVTVKTLPNVQSHHTTSPSLPVPSEELGAIHCSIPLMESSYIRALLLHNGLWLLLCCPHCCTGADARQLGYQFLPNTGLLPSASSLVSMVSSPFPFKPSLKPSLSAQPIHRLEPFCLF